MLSWVLEQAGLQPGFLVGGVPLNFGVSARLGALRPGAPFVIEADEYDTAFFDKRSKFVHYRPRTAVLNNLEFDHADIFDNLAAIERQFHHLVRTVPGQGRVVYNGLEESLTRVLHAGCWSEQRSFGAAVSDFSAEGEASDFAVLHQGHTAGRVQWALSGTHNQLNALAAIAAADHLGVAVADSAAALGRFENVKRRMEERGRLALPGGEVVVYDDFAHHPTAIRTTVDGLRRQLDREGLAPGAHSGGVRTPFQHHEAGHHESPAALEPGTRRAGLLPQRRPGLGRGRSAAASGRARGGLCRCGFAGGGGGGPDPARRPAAVHEQRRLWRGARPSAGRLARRFGAPTVQ
jgi:hypothetical protein